MSDECDGCVKDKFDKLSKLVYTMSGQLIAYTRTNVAVIALSILVSVIAYVGTNAIAGDVADNKADIKIIHADNKAKDADNKREHAYFMSELEALRLAGVVQTQIILDAIEDSK